MRSPTRNGIRFLPVQTFHPEEFQRSIFFMKQLLQNMSNGKTKVVEVPVPAVRPGTALVHNAVSLVSAGTERMVVEFAEKNLLGKARSRPDLVRQVLDKARREGVVPTLEAALNRLDQPMTLGYSSTGTIVALGEGMHGFQIGDRVACAGSGYAVHAEYGVIPRNLLTPLPPEVDFESAAFTTLGAIALHGFRLAQPQVGERVAIIGLGLLGLLALGISQAAGCDAFGVDLDAERVSLAHLLGHAATLRSEAEAAAQIFTQGQGFDVVLICADTRSNDPTELAGLLARDRGRVVAIGAVGMDVPRKIYYAKELSLQVSRSYGPGRYDPQYEEKGIDYPPGYVRWSEGRNMAAFVQMLAARQVNVQPLVTHRFPIEQGAEAYELITGKNGQAFLGVLLIYPQAEITANTKVSLRTGGSTTPVGEVSVGVLGAGNYASAVFLPAVQKVGGVHLKGIASASGVTARHAAQRYGFEFAASAESEILNNPQVNLVAILTRHQLHARQVLAALQAGQHVYCEKPLALNSAELEEIFAALDEQPHPPLLTVGFNRRFSPLARQLKDFLSGYREPLVAHYRVNAGYLPPEHWLHDPHVGGGRIIGEGCHFIDFLTFLTGASPTRVSAQVLPDAGRYHQDNVVLTLIYPDGSIGTLAYLANGDKSYSKERLEVFCGGGVAVLDDFRSLELTANGRRRRSRAALGQQDKGHQAAWKAFVATVKRGGPPPIPYEQLWGVTAASFAAAEALRSGQPVPVPPRPPAHPFPVDR